MVGTARTWTCPLCLQSRRWALEFEGAFQVATVYVNGREMGQHRGGYTGFGGPHARTARRAQPHRREGGQTAGTRPWHRVPVSTCSAAASYRDVWLVATDALHVPWAGVGVTTLAWLIGNRRFRSRPRCANTESAALSVTAETELLTDAGRRVARLPATQQRIEPGQIGRLMQRSEVLRQVALWSPETPTLYRVRTTLKVGGQVRDVVETSFGFRWVQWTADKGFFLNGQHRYFRWRQRPPGPSRLG